MIRRGPPLLTGGELCHMIGAYVPVELVHRLDEIQERTGLTKKELVTAAIELLVEQIDEITAD